MSATGGAEPCTCKGMAEHIWTLGIEERRPYVKTEPCGPECHFRHGLGDEAEFLYMEPVAVRLGMATDCPAWDQDAYGIATTKHPMPGYEHGSHYIAHGTRCDCNWWPVVVPA